MNDVDVNARNHESGATAAEETARATAANRRRIGTLFTHALAIGLAATMLVPFLWMVSTSLMTEFEVYQFPPRILPAKPLWSNYPNALTAAPFGRFFLNSGIMSLFIVFGHLATASTAGYAFARLRFPGRDKVFVLFLANLMVPVIVLLIPRFLLVNAVGWVDTYAGLIVTELVGVWGIFLMRQYFLSIPRDLEDAARIDGASEWQVFWKVALPLSKPALATVLRIPGLGRLSRHRDDGTEGTQGLHHHRRDVRRQDHLPLRERQEPGRLQT